jgi:glutamate-ammonia-ligase adenylyltransferase
VLAQADDFQQTLDLARRWANDRKFQVGVLTLRALIGTDRAAEALSDIAQAILAGLGPRVEAEFARAHGRVLGGAWVILAMGKAGGREMSATSDLDLILIYDAPEEAEESDGPKPLAAATWFARLTQRMVNALSAKTGEGTLYEVDMRLRPSGHSGPIAASLEAFARYQSEAAWTWEHMALTRARIVVGDPALGGRVEAVIRETLCRQRDIGRLLADVADMRARIAREHKGGSPWDVKHRRGGLVDIEFIAQTLQLAHAHTHPEILHPTTAIALERAQAAGLLDPGDAAALGEALALWSSLQTVLRLTVEQGAGAEAAPQGLQDLLLRVTGFDAFPRLVDWMEACAIQSFAVFERLIDVPAQAFSSPPPQETRP